MNYLTLFGKTIRFVPYLLKRPDPDLIHLDPSETLVIDNLQWQKLFWRLIAKKRTRVYLTGTGRRVNVSTVFQAWQMKLPLSWQHSWVSLVISFPSAPLRYGTPRGQLFRNRTQRGTRKVPVLRIRDVYPGYEFFHLGSPGSKRFRIPDPNPH